MSIDWSALGSVAVATLVTTVGLVGLATLGIVGLSRPAALARTGGYACLAGCAAAVAYGISLIAG